MKHSAKVDGRPAFQFYPGDWMADAGLRLSCLAARGLWADMLCLMFDSPERGVLRKQNSSKIASNDLAKMAGASEAEVDALLAELKTNGVYSMAPDGAIYCRRMVKDEHIRQVRAEAGGRGGRASKPKANTQAEKTPPSPSPSPSPSPTATTGAAVPARPPEPTTAQKTIAPPILALGTALLGTGARSLLTEALQGLDELHTLSWLLVLDKRAKEGTVRAPAAYWRDLWPKGGTAPDWALAEAKKRLRPHKEDGR